MDRAPPNEADPLRRLVAIMARLRDSAAGCPWDLEQTFATIAPYTIEEAYEVADAIERDDLVELKDELGDLLLQVVFHARMAEEVGVFAFDDVAEAICAKMIRRHPHVFGEGHHRDAAEQTAAWEQIKAAERAAKAKAAAAGPRLLDNVPSALPALMRADKLTRRAARVGFTWSAPEEVLEKLKEELAELAVEVEAGDRAKMQDEMGDVLFVCANLARLLDIDPEVALRASNAKFVRRFNKIEDALEQMGKTFEESDLAEMDRLWNAAKAKEQG
ncbi:MAG TPA: nucleoside triphosphate pyrophosphohydrolase [Caulobacteraceae bacterium]|nr:nucleoside triphosphate pyrophosphohydrolase [Caulobacteraceae bacterium]